MPESAIVKKYRPKDFDEVIGQDGIVKSLRNAIDKHLGTAFLFTGPSGCGKTTLARIAARSLGCLPEDIQEEDAATKTGIDEMREIIETLQYMPLGEGDSKAIIIDECHALSKNAITALLKSLEDPPEWVYWFLCTTEPDKIPKAIQTRCLSYQLKEVRVTELAELLKGTEEAEDIPEDIISLCAREANGSPRQALANLGVCLTAEDRDEAADMLRSAEADPVAFDLARALIKRASWDDLCGILGKLKEKQVDPESVRHVVRAFMTTVVLKPKDTRSRDIGFAVLEQFDTPFMRADGISPLVLACGRLALAG